MARELKSIMAVPAKYEIATEAARRILLEALKRPSRTSKRQQQLLTTAIHDGTDERWPPDVGGTRSDVVVYEKIWRAIHTGRITKEECRTIAGEMFGAKHRHHFDFAMDELARICSD